MGRLRLATLTGLAAVVCSMGIPDAAAQDEAVAQELFKRGLKQMLEGNWEGCEKLSESYRLDPRPGTLFTTAECRAKEGKIATAVARYREYLRMFRRMTPLQQSKQRGRDEISDAQVKKLDPLVPKLTISLKGNGDGATISRNDTMLGPAAVGVPLPVDPGKHKVRLQFPDGREVTEYVEIQQAERKTVVLQVPKATKKALPIGGQGQHAPEGGTPTFVYYAAGAGVLGVLVGSGAGAFVFSKKPTIADHCFNRVCDREGLSAADDAKTWGTVSNVAFGVGFAGLATATIVYLATPSTGLGAASRPSTTAARVRPAAASNGSNGWLGLEGRF